MYIICEKDYIERLGYKLENETNIGDSDTVDDLIEIIKNNRDIEIAKRTIYNAIKTGKPIFNKYYIYKIREEEEYEQTRNV